VKKSRAERRSEWKKIVTHGKRESANAFGGPQRLLLSGALIVMGTVGLVRGIHGSQSGTRPWEVLGLNARGIAINLTDYLALSVGFLAVGLVGLFIGTRNRGAEKGNPEDDDGAT
jgi:hypothetical protein